MSGESYKKIDKLIDDIKTTYNSMSHMARIHDIKGKYKKYIEEFYSKNFRQY